jgi:hypothetical protein
MGLSRSAAVRSIAQTQYGSGSDSVYPSQHGPNAMRAVPRWMDVRLNGLEDRSRCFVLHY